jgi:TetR/AcrR family transcriptional regulator, transcriptional repressor for nem operon
MGRVSDAKERLMKAVSELIWTGSYGKTTIDQICAKAGVKKGSFYYFFDSKADLAEAALEGAWEEFRPKLDAVFSPTIDPLERFGRYCEMAYEDQAELKVRYGHVLGCPLCSLGTEVSTQEKGLQKKVKEIMDQARKYLETAVRDAHAAGLVRAPDPAAKARTLYAYHEGLLTQARIQNDVEVLKDMLRGTLDILGVRESELLPS